ncbi:hypothetical protein [Natronobacterium texcoconense]|uniref:Uncharacterized protein n=1 Tax=Natronobacterium texcoconense TaxID=1095778 RepID=A0A1H1EYG5_NATTX|nr:hypothetical protein [Natronobacterium texcoconense]SDQ93777.1 hypothetical protein SAMN04489842_1748 [Natronobacterium texcoconense]
MTRRFGSTRSRRTFLAGSTGFLALCAGCLDDGFDDASDPGTGGNDSDDQNGDSETDGGDGETDASGDADELVDDTYPYQHPDVPDSPGATLLLEADDADEWLEDRWEHGEPGDEVTAFVDETSFEDSLLVALEGEGSSLCYEMHLEDADLDGETLALEASVRDESADDESCAMQMTAVGLLVRATFDSDAERPTELSVEIVDDDGDRHEMRIGVDSATDTDE